LLDVGDKDVLHNVHAHHILNHHHYHYHYLRGITAAPKRSLGDVENLNQDVVEDTKGLLLNIVLDEVALVLRTTSGISNLRSQGGSKEAVEAIKLWQEVLDLRQDGLSARSIHEKHFFLLENPVGMDLRLHSVLGLEAKQGGKLKHGDLILSPICHPYKTLTIRIKVKSGIEIEDNIFVPIIIESHHLSHL
jgi:hypothetical protein